MSSINDKSAPTHKKVAITDNEFVKQIETSWGKWTHDVAFDMNTGILAVSNEARQELKKMHEEHAEMWCLYNLLEDIICNSSLTVACADELGHLSTMPIIYEGYVANSGERMVTGKYYYCYEMYQIRSMVDELVEYGFVELALRETGVEEVVEDMYVMQRWVEAPVGIEDNEGTYLLTFVNNRLVSILLAECDECFVGEGMYRLKIETGMTFDEVEKIEGKSEWMMMKF